VSTVWPRRARPGLPEITAPAGPGEPWCLNVRGTNWPIQSVCDDDLGTLMFPGHDRVMVPWIAEHHTWEPLERAWLQKTLRLGSRFLNVGANVGYHALLGAKLVGPKGAVVALEPDPVNFAFLQGNLATHDARNVTPLRVAAGSASGDMRLHRSDDNAGDNRLTPFQGASTSVKVPVRRLDDLLAGQFFDAVLIDTQGWDHEVVAGMTGLLAKGLPPMIVEFVPSWLRDRGEDPEEIVREFQALGYDVGVLEAELAPGASPDEVVAASENDRWWFANLELQPSSGFLRGG
jgi:FkbM family methyltransferase